MAAETRPEPGYALPVGLAGDAHLLFTAPVLCAGDAFQRIHHPWRGPVEGLDGDPGLDAVMNGTLTFRRPVVRGVLGSFRLDDALCPRISAAVNEAAGSPVEPLVGSCEVHGLVFEDGIATVAVDLAVPEGHGRRRDELLRVFGPDGRDGVAAVLHDLLLEQLAPVLRRLDGDDGAQIELPYFNLTYIGEPDGEEPGRRTLDDDLRALVYPPSAAPLVSASPLSEEFFFAGFAYSVLAAEEQDGRVPTRVKLRLLLLLLGYQFARLERGVGAVERRIVPQPGDAKLRDGDVERLELMLSSAFRELAAPTFSFDHHVLVLRDAYLAAWNAELLFERCREVLGAVAEHERRRGIRRLNAIVAVVTLLSVVASGEAAYDLLEKLL